MTTTTQTLFMAALEQGVEQRGHTLVNDREWANTGTVYAVPAGALSPAGATLRYDFQGSDRATFKRGQDPVAHLSALGTADWCYRTAEEVLAVVLDAIAPQAVTR